MGAALCRCLQETGFLVRGTVREQAKLQQHETSKSNDFEWVVLHDRSDEDETRHALQGIHAIVHLAARVHVMNDQASDPLQEFRRVNVGWTDQLARSAALQGIRRFVYLSSIKVNGEQTLFLLPNRILRIRRIRTASRSGRLKRHLLESRRRRGWRPSLFGRRLYTVPGSEGTSCSFWISSAEESRFHWRVSAISAAWSISGISLMPWHDAFKTQEQRAGPTSSVMVRISQLLN